jgi:predicted nucleic acid-binding protein
MPGSFLDSNVLIYLATLDDEKIEASKELLRHDCTVSTQVLNEIANVLRRKRNASWSAVHEFLALVEALMPIVPVDLDCHKLGVDIAERYGFAIYDSLIVAAALQAGCDVLYTEDLQHGQIIDGSLKVVNPYL